MTAAEELAARRQQFALSALVDAAALWIEMALAGAEPERRDVLRQALVDDISRLAVHVRLAPPAAVLAYKGDDGIWLPLGAAGRPIDVPTKGSA